MGTPVAPAQYNVGLISFSEVYKMKAAASGWGPQWLLRMSPDKQDTLLKMMVLTIAAILCMSICLWLLLI